MFDGKTFGEAIVTQVRGFIDKTFASLDQRVKALEERISTSANVIGALIDRDGNLVITMSNGATQSLGLVVGRDGKDGTDGEAGPSGFSLDDFEVKQADDGRTIELIFDAGERKYTRELELPIAIYRGVFKAGEMYAVGDMVTWAGSVWSCTTAGSEKPGDGSKAWVLAVKKGRDGKDAVQ